MDNKICKVINSLKKNYLNDAVYDIASQYKITSRSVTNNWFNKQVPGYAQEFVYSTLKKYLQKQIQEDRKLLETL